MIAQSRIYQIRMLSVLQIWASAVAAAVGEVRFRFDGSSERDYFEPDPFVTERPFVGDDLWR
jgi:hypothetical protein